MITIMISYAIIQCVINILACILFLLEDYVNSSVISTLDLTVAIYFTLEMIWNCYTHPSPQYKYFWSFGFWIDFCAVLPEFVNLIVGSENMKGAGFLRILRVLKIMRIFKLMRVVKLRRKTGELELKIESISRIRRQTIMLVISLFATLFIAAGVVIFIQDTISNSMSEDMKFVDSLYFVVVTVSTIGYGDIFPKKSWSRLAIAIMILVIFTIFGNQISKIVAVWKESDKYDVTYHLKGHIVIFNNKSIQTLTHFILNYMLYYENTKILVIDDVSLSKQMKKFLEFELFVGKVFFLSIRRGIDTKTLVKAGMHQASQIFFLSDPYSIHGDQQDKKALFLKNYLINNQIMAPITLQFSLFDEQYLINFEKDYYQVFEDLIKNNEFLSNPDESINSENIHLKLMSKFINSPPNIL